MAKASHYTEVNPHRAPGCTVDVYEMAADDRLGLVQKILTCEEGTSSPLLVEPGWAAVGFVLDGSGTLRQGAAECRLRSDVAFLIDTDEPYVIEADQRLVISVVEARSYSSIGDAVDAGSTAPAEIRTVDLAEQIVRDAVSEREYRVLLDPESGCRALTQFVGYIPAIRTPLHYHDYNEMICVLSGTGQVEIEGDVTQIGRGSCFYLPAGTRHLVENTGDGFLTLLGVFRPAGSPDRAVAVTG